MQHLVHCGLLKLKNLAVPGLLAFVLGLGTAVSSFAQIASPHEAIFMNKSADREAWLLERAKKEGGLTLYTSLAPTESGPLVAEFEKNTGSKLPCGVASVMVWCNAW